MYVCNAYGYLIYINHKSVWFGIFPFLSLKKIWNHVYNYVSKYKSTKGAHVKAYLMFLRGGWNHPKTFHGF